MPWIVPAISAGASLLGASNAADASQSAANVQSQAAQQAIAEQQREFNINQGNLAPFLATGTAATQRLAMLLGLALPTAAPAAPAPLLQMPTRDQFTASIPGTTLAQAPIFESEGGYSQPIYTGGGSAFDQAGYDAAMAAYNAQQANPPSQAPAQAPASNTSDPAFGSLTAKFTTADLNADPVYQSGLAFGLNQGTDALNARNIANGMGFDSGGTLKQLVQYANDYGSTKASDAYNRFVNDQNNLYSKLTGQASTGQTAASTAGQLGNQATSSISDLLTGQGNAVASGIVGGANAWNGAASGIGSAVNNFNSSSLLSQLLNQNTSGGTFNSGGPGFAQSIFGSAAQ